MTPRANSVAERCEARGGSSRTRRSKRLSLPSPRPLSWSKTNKINWIFVQGFSVIFVFSVQNWYSRYIPASRRGDSSSPMLASLYDSSHSISSSSIATSLGTIAGHRVWMSIYMGPSECTNVSQEIRGFILELMLRDTQENALLGNMLSVHHSETSVMELG